MNGRTMPSSPVRIGVVFGGASGEHAVSIRSAITIINALQEGKNQDHFEVVPVSYTHLTLPTSDLV